MKFAIYGPSGQITQTCVAPSPDDVKSIVPEGFRFCEVSEEVSDDTHYIIGGLTARIPPRPGPEYTFDYSLRTWVDMRTDAQIAMMARAMRDTRISASDWVMLPDVVMSEEKRLLWVEYRQALRDITNQPGFPRNIVWPTKPS